MGLIDKLDQWNYESIYNSALSQCKKAESASSKCTEAKKLIESFLETIDDEWKGTAATAFKSAMTDLLKELDSTIIELNSVHSQMCGQADKVRTEWPALVAETMKQVEDE